MSKYLIFKSIANISKYLFIILVLSMMVFSIATPTALSKILEMEPIVITGNALATNPADFAKKSKGGFFGLNKIAENSGFTTADFGDETGSNVAQIVGRVIGIALSFLGIIFMMLIVYGGFAWMMARGNETESQKAKDILINASIGVIVVFSAFAISDYIVNQLYIATQTKES